MAALRTAAEASGFRGRARDPIRSGILGRLKMLDLMHGRITDDGAKLLAESKDIRNLELLTISSQYNRYKRQSIPNSNDRHYWLKI